MKKKIIIVIGSLVLLAALVEGGLCLHAKHWDSEHGFPWEDVEACVDDEAETLTSRCPICWRQADDGAARPADEGLGGQLDPSPVVRHPAGKAGDGGFPGYPLSGAGRELPPAKGSAEGGDGMR